MVISQIKSLEYRETQKSNIKFRYVNCRFFFRVDSQHQPQSSKILLLPWSSKYHHRLDGKKINSMKPWRWCPTEMSYALLSIAILFLLIIFIIIISSRLWFIINNPKQKGVKEREPSFMPTQQVRPATWSCNQLNKCYKQIQNFAEDEIRIQYSCWL